MRNGTLGALETELLMEEGLEYYRGDTPRRNPMEDRQVKAPTDASEVAVVATNDTGGG